MKTDVCLILEGTYPFVFGGVSSWIHKLVKSYPDLTFSIVHISSTGDTLKSPKYEIPSNILEFKEVYIHDFENEKSKTFGSKAEGWETIRNFYQSTAADDYSKFEDFYKKIINRRTRSLNTDDILYSKDAWNLLVEYSNQQPSSYSFVDLYWTMRFIHAPILSLFNAELPNASVYHTVCTGYAGLLAVIAKLEKKAPMILTEHGIYTHERQIEITRARWLQAGMEDIFRATRSLGFLKDLWIKKFEVLSKLAYRHADEIVTLFEGNRRIQVAGGADPSKIKIIPNGIEIPENVKHTRDGKDGTYSIGFVGRIVPIKDVKTLIRAIKIVKDKIPNLTVYVLGEGSENPQYVEECKTLTQMLGLKDVIVYTGNVEVKDYYPKLDAVILTSISEAQPLSLLEAMSYGVPVVTSDVGACRELVTGKDDIDKQLGASGLISNVGNPNETAEAVVKILQDRKLWEQMSQAGRKRVKQYYTSDKMIEQYRNLYSYFLEKQVVTV